VFASVSLLICQDVVTEVPLSFCTSLEIVSFESLEFLCLKADERLSSPGCQISPGKKLLKLDSVPPPSDILFLFSQFFNVFFIRFWLIVCF